MIILKPKSEIVEIPYSEDSYKKIIEIVGRVCYHSEDRMTPTSYEKFVQNMVHKNHGSVPEHGTIYLYLENPTPEENELIERYKANRFSIVHSDLVFNKYYITTNYRVIFEHDWFDDLKYMCEAKVEHEKRITVKFSMDRVGSQSVERHRGENGNSFLQESTRFCNYGNDKFGNEIKIALPEWVKHNENYNIVEIYNEYNDKFESFRRYCEEISKGGKDELTAIDWWLFGNMACEVAYLNMVRLGIAQEDARSVLPLDLYSELFCTFSISDWKHFFDLRVKGTTGRPHPDIKALCEPLYNEFIKLGYNV